MFFIQNMHIVNAYELAAGNDSSDVFFPPKEKWQVFSLMFGERSFLNLFRSLHSRLQIVECPARTFCLKALANGMVQTLRKPSRQNRIKKEN